MKKESESTIDFDKTMKALLEVPPKKKNKKKQGQKQPDKKKR